MYNYKPGDILKIGFKSFTVDEFEDGIRHIMSEDFEDHYAQDEDGLFYNMMVQYGCEGEMPYGTMKARDGDPYEWTFSRIYDTYQELFL